MHGSGIVEHLDVVVVGAGLSGIGAAVHLQRRLPTQSFAVLESRDAVGGTWDLFRYPGVRSDSDMFTLGYSFRPWTGAKAIDGDDIREYLTATAQQEGVLARVRLRRRVVAASWHSDTARWQLTVHERAADATGEWRAGEPGTETTMTCSFLYVCSGYYRYDQGFSPELPGLAAFGGRVVHPQHWPDGLDVAGKRIVVIGSGATAISLVPALARAGAHTTMLQRSPSYVAAVPSHDSLADRLRGRVPQRLAYRIVRAKRMTTAVALYQFSRRRPAAMKAFLLRAAKAKLPATFDTETHFGPRYAPWDQRLCAVPSGDLFRAISAGTADVVTDRISTIDARGVVLASGGRLDADVLVTATGLNLLTFGGIRVDVDGRVIDPGGTLAYRGMMLAGVPNLAFTIGYVNASWTLKADLVAEYVCRLLARMQRTGARSVVPVAPAEPGVLRPLLDLTSGYIQRSGHLLPRQASRAPWLTHQNYFRDLAVYRFGTLSRDVRFDTVAAHPTPVPVR